MSIMEELLASQSKKITKLFRGQQVEGEIGSITDKEITLDIGAKSEGILQKKDLSLSQAKDLKLGQLETELSVWQSKLEVILKETVGRQGMAKHASFWAEKLRQLPPTPSLK